MLKKFYCFCAAHFAVSIVIHNRGIEEVDYGLIVLLSTHIVSDVEHIADHMLMMSEGKIILNESWDKSRTDLEQLYLKEFGGEEE